MPRKGVTKKITKSKVKGKRMKQETLKDAKE
jgi:hypothetical protein